MIESKNNISIEDNKNIIKQKDINNSKYLSIEEEVNLKLEQSVNNTKNFNKNIILKLKKKNLNYKILSIFLISIIMILLIILSIILYSKTCNLLKKKKKNKTSLVNDGKNKTSNSSIFDIVYNDIIFKNYISGDFFLKLSNNKTIFYVKTDYLDNQAWRVTKNYTVLITHNSAYKIDSSKFKKFLQCGKFKYWFAQNPIINEPRLFTLPVSFLSIQL